MKSLFIPILLFYSSFVFGNAKVVGNGGNGIVCRNSSGSVISTELLDYYEMRLNGGQLSLNENLGTYQNILNDLFSRWSDFAPVRMTQYKKWLSEFPQEAGIYGGVTIPEVPDTGSIVIPSGCDLKPIAFQRPDEEVLPGVKRYTINKDIWDLMPEVQKAGLVLHELIYREGIKVGHKTSFSTRYFNGYLSSAKPNYMEYAHVVSQMPLLWTEFLGKVIVQIGVMQGPMGCPSCNPSFKRMSDISADGRNLNLVITSVMDDIDTNDFTIRFSKRGDLRLRLNFKLSDEVFFLSPIFDDAPTVTPGYAEVTLKNYFSFQKFGFAYSIGYNRLRKRLHLRDLSLGENSWYANGSEIIRNIKRISSDSLFTDVLWYWNKEENRYVKNPKTSP